jgi:hypothetical protein
MDLKIIDWYKKVEPDTLRNALIWNLEDFFEKRGINRAKEHVSNLSSAISFGFSWRNAIYFPSGDKVPNGYDIDKLYKEWDVIYEQSEKDLIPIIDYKQKISLWM